MSGGYRPGLDGLRAIAVGAVVLFHLDRLPGGNLGVDAFFVVSGWLITWRLLNEAERTGTLDVRSFWNARLRRLLPASLMMLAVVAIVWPLAGIEVSSLRRDLLWAGGWASNWGTIAGGGDYWARFGEPSPVTHFWSLAIEEQFYLAWPLVLLAIVAFVRRDRHRRVAVGVVSVVAACGSIVAMNVMFDPTDPTGTYMNTFARAHSLLIGAAAAALTTVLADGSLRGGRRARRIAPAAVVIVVATAAMSSSESTWLFRWGFATFAVAMAVVVVAVADGAGRGVLARPPMRWIGERSYGIYLWHWPVFLLLTPARVGVPDVPFAVATVDLTRVALAVVLADLSFRFVESPIRAVRPTVQWRTPALAGVAVFAVALLAVTAVPPRPAASDAAVVTLPPVPPPAAEPVSVEPAPGSTEIETASSAPAQDHSAGRTVSTAAAEVLEVSPVGPVRVLVAGDSTALHLSESLLAHASRVPDQLAVGSAAFPGCGLSAAADGRRHEFTNSGGERELVDLSGCLTQWESVPERVVTEAIDVVLVSIGPWDAVDIHVGGGVVAIDDPVGGPLVEEAYQRFIAEVRAAGATVVWITPADTHLGWGNVDDPLNDPDRWIATRAIIDRLDVVQVDLPGWLSGQALDGPEGRPDGVHLTDELNVRFVDELVAPTLQWLRRPG